MAAAWNPDDISTDLLTSDFTVRYLNLNFIITPVKLKRMNWYIILEGLKFFRIFVRATVFPLEIATPL